MDSFGAPGLRETRLTQTRTKPAQRFMRIHGRNLASIALTVQHERVKQVPFSLYRGSLMCMPEEVTHMKWSDVAIEQLNPLLTRQFVTGSEAMFARLELKKGCIVPRHQHPNEQISYITEGALRFSLGEEGASVDKVVRAGAVLVIPGNLPHSAEALEDTVDFDIFAPPRKDWIAKDDSYLR
jgi:quercetin dioxygenase-like cupin family protein